MKLAGILAIVLLAALGAEAAAAAPARTPPTRHRPARVHRRPTLTLPYVAHRVCPFECCVYRRWRALSRLRVYAGERDTAQVAFTIAPGDSFEALTGDVYVLRPGTASVLDAHVLRLGGVRIALARGDSIPLLDYEGEGGYRAWVRGHATAVGEDDFALSDRAPERLQWLRFVRGPETEWWVRIRTEDGQDGWLRMDDDQDVENADACA
jgi:hypothetical protein